MGFPVVVVRSGAEMLPLPRRRRRRKGKPRRKDVCAARGWTFRFLLLLCFAGLFGTAFARAQGGPPFRTDDPDTPGNRHWEINFGFIGDRNPSTGAYQVPDFDINYGLGDRIQLKYELPIALEETRAQPSSDSAASTNETVIGGLGQSLVGIKWRFYEHHAEDASFGKGFGTGLLALFGRGKTFTKPAGVSGDSPGAADKPAVTGTSPATFEMGTYPQVYLNNPNSAVARGLVPSGPSFFLPIEVSGRVGPIRYNANAGYNFGNRSVAQSWNRGFVVGHEFSDRTELYVELYDLQDANRKPFGLGTGNFAASGIKQRETTLGLGGRQALNQTRTLNLLLMGGRSFQTPSASTGQPGWIAYVGLQVLLGPRRFNQTGG